MSEPTPGLKRYDMEWVGPTFSQFQEMREAPDGYWVDWDDVEPKLQQREDLLAACEAALEQSGLKLWVEKKMSDAVARARGTESEG